MDYTCVRLSCKHGFAEILMAEMSDSFETFAETEEGFDAFTIGDCGEAMQTLMTHYPEAEIKYRIEVIGKKNWNEEWEKNVPPVMVAEQCLIRASFHQSEKKYPYEIIITPKMSFGTGHHPTTYLMLENQLTIDHQNKKVMDAGCGTAILSVMAHLRGAAGVEAFDIDDWSVENGRENIEINNAQVNIRKGCIRTLTFPHVFDIILANINRNILLDEMKEYARHSAAGGTLLLSGFLESDAEAIKEGLQPYFTFQSLSRKEGWCAMTARKNNGI